MRILILILSLFVISCNSTCNGSSYSECSKMCHDRVKSFSDWNGTCECQ